MPVRVVFVFFIYFFGAEMALHYKYKKSSMIATKGFWFSDVSRGHPLVVVEQYHTIVVQYVFSMKIIFIRIDQPIRFMMID